MAYTEADLESVKAAKMALATGERIARVTLGDKTIEYSPTQLKDLGTLEAEIKANLETLSGKSRVYVTQTSKGL